MLFSRIGTTVVLLLFSTAVLADAERAIALQWLERIAKSARQLNFAGTFIYQHSQQMETSRITHFADRSGEYEKLITLDGPKREIIRMNDQIYCFDYDRNVLRKERQTGRNNFPALIPEKLSQVTDFYELRMGGQERIAGFDTQQISLEPKDGYRYGHRFWADVTTGLLIKAKRLNERKEVLEQFTFTQLEIGPQVTRDMTRSSGEPGPNWRTDSVSADSSQSAGPGSWSVKSYPAGFQKVVEMRRVREGTNGVVTHIVFSDGLASISVFIEPLSLKRRSLEGLVQHGAVNILFRPVLDQMITVVGEAPPSTIYLIGNSVSQQNK